MTTCRSSAPAALWRRRSPTGGGTAACRGSSIRARPAFRARSRVARACQRAWGLLSSWASSAGRSGAAGRSAHEAAPARLRCCLWRVRRLHPPSCASPTRCRRLAQPPQHRPRPARRRRGLQHASGAPRALRLRRGRRSPEIRWGEGRARTRREFNNCEKSTGRGGLTVGQVSALEYSQLLRDADRETRDLVCAGAPSARAVPRHAKVQ